MSNVKDFELPLPDVVNGAIGAFGPYCMGYLNPGASGNGYISTIKLSVGKVSIVGLDKGTEGIVSYDRCQKNDAYAGQVNFIKVPSFCGLNGALWGYHLAKAEEIANGTLEPMFTYPGPGYPADEKLREQDPIPVYPLGPILDTIVRLFGRMDQVDKTVPPVDRRRFPPMPGAHVPWAVNHAAVRGPAYVWSAFAVAVPNDPKTEAHVFVEDADVIPAQLVTNPDGKIETIPSPEQVKGTLLGRLHSIAKCQILCGQDQGVVLTKIFTGGKFIYAGPGEWGCALTCAPYIVLARDAIPSNWEASMLLDKTIGEWEEELGLQPLPPAPVDPDVGSVGC